MMVMLARFAAVFAIASGVIFATPVHAICMEFQPDRDAENAAQRIIANASVIMYARVIKAETRTKMGFVPAELRAIDLLKGPRLNRYVMGVPSIGPSERYEGLSYPRVGDQIFIVLYGVNRHYETYPCDYSDNNYVRAALVRTIRHVPAK